MTLARRIAALYIALEAGYELKIDTGHTVVWEDDLGPGFLMKRTKNGQTEDVVMQINSDVVNMCVILTAQGMKPEQFEAIEKQFRTEAAREA